MDPLVPIPVEKWADIQEKLKEMRTLLNNVGYCALNVNLKCPELREAFKFNVYSPYGDIDNGFVALNDKNRIDCILFSISEDTRLLEEAILNTKLIDWSKQVSFEMTSTLTLNVVKNIISCLGLSSFLTDYTTFGFERSKKPFILSCPTGIYLAPLREHHIERVNETWHYKYNDSYFYFLKLAKHYVAQAVYSSDDDELLAWVFLNEYGFIRHLYCEEKHRRKGYAKYLLKCVLNDQLAKCNDVYVNVTENESSSGFYEKLGFVEVGNGTTARVQNINIIT